MPIPYASSSFAGVAFGLLLSAPAAGFEPMSRAYRSQAAVPANVVILLDSSSSMAMTYAESLRALVRLDPRATDIRSDLCCGIEAFAKDRNNLLLLLSKPPGPIDTMCM